MASGMGSVPSPSGSGGGTGSGDGNRPGGGNTPGCGPGHALTAEERAEYERLRRHAGVRHRRLREAGAAVLLADSGAPPGVVVAGAGALDGPLRSVVSTVVERHVTHTAGRGVATGVAGPGIYTMVRP